MAQAVVAVAGWVATTWTAIGSLGIIGGAIQGAIIGGAIGGLTSAVTGGDIGKGILFGAVGGAVLGGVGAYLGGESLMGVGLEGVGEVAAIGPSAVPTISPAGAKVMVGGGKGLLGGGIGGGVAEAVVTAGGQMLMGMDEPEQMSEADKLAWQAEQGDKKRELQLQLGEMNRKGDRRLAIAK